MTSNQPAKGQSICPPLNLDALKKMQSSQSKEAFNMPPVYLSKAVADPLYYKRRPQKSNGFETTRSVITAASPSSTSQIMTARVDIKSELKDKIIITRERFNQLKYRKRNQLSVDNPLT